MLISGGMFIRKIIKIIFWPTHKKKKGEMTE